MKLGLGNGEFAVKSTGVNGAMSQAVGAVNSGGDAVAFINNYSVKSYDNVILNMKMFPMRPDPRSLPWSTRQRTVRRTGGLGLATT